jgi:triosephosphate isomerase
MRIPLVVGNWKMHGTQEVARELAQAVRDGLKRPRGVEVVVCPPFTALPVVAEVLKGAAVALGAQNCHWEPQGAFTGEVSPAMLAELGCRWVLVGHSERRHVFRETDEEINRKVGAALRHGMRPILCVGETDEERRQGLTFTVVEGQLRAGWAGLSPEDLARYGPSAPATSRPRPRPRRCTATSAASCPRSPPRSWPSRCASCTGGASSPTTPRR